MNEFRDTWGLYPWQPSRGEQLIHPDDRTNLGWNSLLGKIFYCTDITNDGYIIIRDASNQYRVRPDIYYIVPKPVFHYGDLVRDKENPERVGAIYIIDWHFKHKREYYNLRFNNRESTRRYFSDELELVERANQ